MYGRDLDDGFELWVPIGERKRALTLLPTARFPDAPCPTCEGPLRVVGDASGFVVLAVAVAAGWMMMNGHLAAGAGIFIGGAIAARSLQQEPAASRCSKCRAFFTTGELRQINAALAQIEESRPQIED